MPTTGSTAGNIIAAIIATQATRNATSDIVGCGCIGTPSTDIVSAPMSPAVTADHHQPSPATVSNPACSQISRLPATLRTSLARTQPPSVVPDQLSHRRPAKAADLPTYAVSSMWWAPVTLP